MLIFQYQLFIVSAMIGFMASFAGLLVIMRRDVRLANRAIRRSLSIYLILSLMYVLNNTFELILPDATTALFLARLDYFYLAFIPVAWLDFIFAFTNNTEAMKIKRFWPFLVIPCLTLLIVLSPLHQGLIWSTITVEKIGIYNLVRASSYGEWFWVHALHGNLVFLYGVVLLVVQYFKGQESFRKQARIIILSLLIPFILIILYIFRLVPGMQKDFSAVSFAITGAFFVWGILRYGLLDIRPVARGVVVENLSDGLVLLNSEDILIDMNPAAMHLFGPAISDNFGRPFVESFPSWAKISEQIHADPFFQTDIEMVEDGQSQIFNIEAQHIPNKIGSILTFRNVTFFREAAKAMRNQQDTLVTLIEERTLELSNLNANLEDRVKERTRDLAALYSISSVLGETTTLEEFLAVSISRSLDAVGGKGGVIYLLEKNPNEGERKLKKARAQGVSEEITAELASCITQLGFIGSMSKEGGTFHLAPELIQQCMAKSTEVQEENSNILVVPIQFSDTSIGNFALLRPDFEPFSEGDIELVSNIARQIGVGVVKHYFQHEAEKAQLLEERISLAADLHDSVSQSLYGISAFSDAAGRHFRQGDIEAGVLLVDRIDQETRTALKEFRLFLFNLHPLVVEEEGLEAAINKRLVAVETRTGLKAELRVEGEIPVLPQKVAENLYHITQEALNNTMRHSKASLVEVVINVEEKQLILTIKDNGKGFLPDSLPVGGMGIGNIKRRAETCQGIAQIYSSPENGCTVEVAVPLKPNADADNESIVTRIAI